MAMERIRRAIPEDADTIVHFIAEEAREAESRSLDFAVVEEGVRNGLAGAVPRYWVATGDHGRRIVASASVYTEWSDWNNAEYWWIQSFYIVPSARGTGLAQRLVHMIEDEAEAAGVIELRLYVHNGNRRAMAAYEKAGFSATPYEVLSKRIPRKRRNA